MRSQEWQYNLKKEGGASYIIHNGSLGVRMMDFWIQLFLSCSLFSLHTFYWEFMDPPPLGVQVLFIRVEVPSSLSIYRVDERKERYLSYLFFFASFEMNVGGSMGVWHYSSGHSVLNTAWLVGKAHLMRKW